MIALDRRKFSSDRVQADPLLPRCTTERADIYRFMHAVRMVAEYHQDLHVRSKASTVARQLQELWAFMGVGPALRESGERPEAADGLVDDGEDAEQATAGLCLHG